MIDLISRDGPSKGALSASGLRCEHRVNPVGVGVKRPRLGWIVESARRDQVQTAYQILVAASKSALGREEGDRWDSGEVESDETADIAYAGRTLAAHERCFWMVRVWDGQGGPSEWSEPASWSAGPSSDDWSASQWIGFDRFHQTALLDAPLNGAKWIWFADDVDPVGKVSRSFTATVVLPAGASVRSAKLCITATDFFTCYINGAVAAESRNLPDWKRPGTFDVSKMISQEENRILVRVRHKTSDLAGLALKGIITLDDGETHVFVSDGSWLATAGEETDGQWSAVRVLGEYGAKPWGTLKSDEPVLPPPAYLRRDFEVPRPVRSAMLYVTAMGIVDVHLNGRRVSEDRFNPGWTDYVKRVHYRAYDVTDELRPGANTIGAILADGWFSGYVGYARRRDLYGNTTRFRGLLHLEFKDGTSQIIGTDANWRAAIGPIVSADFLAGEAYDAGLEQAGWDGPGFNAETWSSIDVGADLDPVISWHPAPAVSYAGDFRAKEITEPRPGVYILDVGQNLAGVPRLIIQGQAGQQITLRFAERLNPDGTLHTANLRTARATDSYICRGNGIETWEPRFTFHGFQYIEIAGLAGPPAMDAVYAKALSSQTPGAGSFECSDPIVNQLASNIYWTQRANFIDIPTDCPQRDERLGWTGDTQVYLGAAALFCDVHAFFDKWLVDLADSQRADGQFPMVAPLKIAGDDGGPAWADAGVICPWTLYEIYGDRQVLERHYPSMKRFIEFCKNRSTSGLLPPEKYHCFGDWLNIDADTPKDVIYMAYFARSTYLAARTAAVLGQLRDAEEFGELFARIKAAFNSAYVGADGTIRGDTQTCYVLALAVDLLDDRGRTLAADRLVADIERRGGHLSTGFVGTRDLMLVLAKIGRNDVAYRLLGQKTWPSWGAAIAAGATSIWERWDGWTIEKGFQDAEMNSFSHYAFGAVYQWMVENIGGIRAAAPGYKSIVIAPQPGGGLTWARTRYASVRGTIETAWKLDGDHFLLDVVIPANTRAEIRMPATFAAEITENGIPAALRDDIALARREATYAAYSVGSGRYRFESTG